MNAIAKLVAACSILPALASPAIAHHSAAAFDTRKEVKLTGTIVKYRFANPHIYLTLQVKKDDGTTADVEVEAGAASVLNGLGFTRESVRIGDVVTVVGNPDRNKPDAIVLGRDLYKRDGSYVPLNIASRSVYAGRTEGTAASIAGTWFSPSTDFYNFIGSVAKASLTEKAKAVMSSVDPKATAQKDCIPVGPPTLMLYPVASTITVQRDRVLLKVDWMDTQRTVWLDGRAHPPAGQTFVHGHSIGRWEGKTLVVETTNFQAHPIGNSTTMPASAEKRLTERFAPGDDGKSLMYSGVVEDPVYFAKPLLFTGKLEYRPNMPFSNQKCDLEVARRFLTQ